jgi:hypothetical protein
VIEAANSLPDELGKRLADAEKLTDADRRQVTEIARQAIASLLAPTEPHSTPPEASAKTAKKETP